MNRDETPAALPRPAVGVGGFALGTAMPVIWLGMPSVLFAWHLLSGVSLSFFGTSFLMLAMGPLAFFVLLLPLWLGALLGIVMFVVLPWLVCKSRCWPLASLLWFAPGFALLHWVVSMASA